jgi:hypothetical protein
MEHNISFVSFKKGRTNEVRKKSNDFEVPLSEEKRLRRSREFQSKLNDKKDGNDIDIFNSDSLLEKHQIKLKKKLLKKNDHLYLIMHLMVDIYLNLLWYLYEKVN